MTDSNNVINIEESDPEIGKKLQGALQTLLGDDYAAPPSVQAQLDEIDEKYLGVNPEEEENMESKEKKSGKDMKTLQALKEQEEKEEKEKEKKSVAIDQPDVSDTEKGETRKRGYQPRTEEVSSPEDMFGPSTSKYKNADPLSSDTESEEDYSRKRKKNKEEVTLTLTQDKYDKMVQDLKELEALKQEKEEKEEKKRKEKEREQEREKARRQRTFRTMSLEDIQSYELTNADLLRPVILNRCSRRAKVYLIKTWICWLAELARENINGLPDGIASYRKKQVNEGPYCHLLEEHCMDVTAFSTCEARLKNYNCRYWHFTCSLCSTAFGYVVKGHAFTSNCQTFIAAVTQVTMVNASQLKKKA